MVNETVHLVAKSKIGLAHDMMLVWYQVLLTAY